MPSPPAPTSDPTITFRSLTALGTETSDAMHAATDFRDLIRAATRHCQKLVRSRRARIWTTQRDGRRLVCREFPPDLDERGVEHRMLAGEGLAGWCIARSQALRLAPQDPRPELRGPVPEFRSALVVPLFRRGAVFGAIECLDKDGEPEFGAADFDQLEMASEHIAFALDRALLFKEARRRALEREVLLEVTRAISTPLELDEVIEAIFEALHQVVDFDAAAIYLVNPHTRAVERVSSRGYPAGSEDAFRLEVGEGIVGWVATHGEAVIVPDVRRDPRYVPARIETRSEVAAPLVVEGRTIGVFNLESDLEDAYHDDHVELLGAFAAQAAVALERARMTRELVERRHLEKELTIARDIQRSFLPKGAPRVPGFEIAGTNQTHHEVGGDYYDFIRVAESRLGLAIADVAGKGIPAALILAGFRMCLLAEIRNEFAIRAVMRKVNSLIHESTERDKFVTAFYGLLDIKNRVLSFCNAGHNPPILVRRQGGIEYLAEGGVALGVLPEARYEERPIALRPGDVLVLYTDGVSECESPTGEMFGSRRIEEHVARAMDRSATEILEGIIAEVTDWAGEKGINDDLTLVVLRVLAE